VATKLYPPARLLTSSVCTHLVLAVETFGPTTESEKPVTSPTNTGFGSLVLCRWWRLELAGFFYRTIPDATSSGLSNQDAILGTYRIAVVFDKGRSKKAGLT
jgi:hypothetical protein